MVNSTFWVFSCHVYPGQAMSPKNHVIDIDVKVAVTAQCSHRLSNFPSSSIASSLKRSVFRVVSHDFFKTFLSWKFSSFSHNDA